MAALTGLFRERRQLLAFAFLAVMGIIGLYRVESAIDDIEHERYQRTLIACQSEHREQIDARRDAIEAHRQLPRFARFFQGDPQELLKVAAANTRNQLHGRYGNNRIPSYCPQHDWPEDERQWPPELRTP